MITAPMRKTSWRPFYAASAWSTLWAQMHATMADRAAAKGRHLDAPPITNAEAVALLRVWRGVTDRTGALWHQFAARAYGWNPPTRDTLRTDAKQAAAEYPDARELWSWSKGIAAELDERKLDVPASVAPNRDTFADPTFYGDVRARLHGDGARAPVATGKREIVVVERKQGSATWLLWVAAAWLLLSPKRRAPGRKGRR